MSGYVKTMQVPALLLKWETLMMFKQLSAKGKDRTFRAFCRWAAEARRRNAEISIEAPPDFSEDEADVFLAMAENASAGFQTYWGHCKKSEKKEEPAEGPREADFRPREAEPGSVPDRTKKENKEREKQEETERESLTNPPAGGERRAPPEAPGVKDVQAFARENGLPDEAEAFVRYYESRGWILRSGQTVMDWRALYRSWLQRSGQFGTAAAGPKTRACSHPSLEREYDERELEERLGITDLFRANA